MSLVPFTMIKNDRVVRNREGLKDLAAEMKTGNYEPIILWQDMTLIDGLRRLEAAKTLGWEEVDATIVSDVFELMDLLSDAHKAAMPDIYRVYQFHVPLKELLRQHHKELRTAGFWAIKNRPEGVRSMKLSRYLMTALNLPYDGYANRVWRLLHGAANGDELATDLLKRHEAGEITQGTAFNRLENRPKALDNLSREEQRTIIAESNRSMAIITRTLWRLVGPNLSLPREEILSLTEEMKVRRRDLHAVVNRLAREAQKSQ